MSSNEEDDDFDEESKCPICFDQFKFPKLLQCRHTFCKSCLNTYKKQKQTEDNLLSCPMCRENHCLLKDGIQSVLTNYFVNDKSIKGDKFCKECGKELQLENSKCDDCSPQDLALINVELDDSDIEGGEVFDVLLPFNLKWLLQTKIKAKQIASICLADDPSDRCMITALFPTVDNHCWTVMGCQPKLVKLDTSCEVRQSYRIETFSETQLTVYDVVCRKDGFILTLTKYEVAKLNPETSIITNFISTPGFCGEDMALFPDDRLVIVGTRHFEDPRSLLQLKERGQQSNEKYSQILVFSEDGKQIRSLGTSSDQLDLNAVAVNPVGNFICTTDLKTQSVIVMLEDGDVIGRFSADVPGLFSFGINTFKPGGICCLPNGYIIISDESTGLLYVLSLDGSFRGIVIANNDQPFQSPFQNPFLVACGGSGDFLWVGDRFNGELKVFRLIGYSNRLQRNLF